MSEAAEDISREYLELALSGLQSLPGAWVAFFDRDLRYVLAAGAGSPRQASTPPRSRADS